MSVELTLTIDDELYEKVQRLAQKRQQNVTEVVANALDDLLLLEDEDSEVLDWAAPDEAVEREMQAYRTMHPILWAKFPGEHVAIHSGQLIDHDSDGVALSQRIYRSFPDEFVLIRQVEEEVERVLVFRSPRLESTD